MAEDFDVYAENSRLRREVEELRAKLEKKKDKLKRSRESVDDLSERKAEEILRNDERCNRIVVHVKEGGIVNLYESPSRASPSSPRSPAKAPTYVPYNPNQPYDPEHWSDDNPIKRKLF
jgi:hypothetical protein